MLAYRQTFWRALLIIVFVTVIPTMLLFSSLFVNAHAEDLVELKPDKKTALLISSYHPGFPTFFQQIDSVKLSALKGGPSKQRWGGIAPLFPLLRIYPFLRSAVSKIRRSV